MSFINFNYGYADDAQNILDSRRHDIHDLIGGQIQQMQQPAFQSPPVPPTQQVQQSTFSTQTGYSPLQATIRIQGETWDSRRFMNSIPLMGASLNNPRSFHQNNGFWYSSESNGRQKPIASFSINRVLTINPAQEHTFEHIVIEYTAQGQVFVAKIPFEKYRHRKLLPYFPNIQKHPDCRESLLSELLFDQVQNCKNGVFLTIPEKPGWNIPDDGQAAFLTGNGIAPFMMEFYPDSVKKRLLPEISGTDVLAGNVLSELERLASQHWKIKVLLSLHIASLVRTLFDREGIASRCILVAEPSVSVSEETIIAMMKTQNFNSLVANSVESPRNVIEKILDDTNDGVAVFRDTSYIDEEKKIRTGLDCIAREAQQADGKENFSHHLVCIVSRYAGRHLPKEYICRLSLEDVVVKDFEPKQIQHLMGCLDTLLIHSITHNFNNFIDIIHKTIDLCNRTPQDSNVIPDCKRNLLIQMICAFQILRGGFNCMLYSNETIKNIDEWIETNKEDIDIAQEIVDDFGDVINRNIHSGKFRLIRKNDDGVFQKGSDSIIVMEYELCFEPEMFQRSILPQMTTTHSEGSLIEALKECGYLCATNKNRRPIQVYVSGGRKTTIHAYSVSQQILDRDNQLKADNLGNVEFFLADAEIDKSAFLPLVCGINNQTAGRQILFQDAENNHVYVTGQSGYGKSWMLSQLVAFLTRMKHTTVIFDTSSSFTREALSRNLSEKFVSESVQFISLEHDGIPVNLFSIDECYNLSEKKNTLFKVIAAAARDMNNAKTGRLKEAISAVLASPDFDGKVDTAAILENLGDKKATCASLRLRLNSVFEDIDSCGMSDDNWDKILTSAGKITVISSETADTENGTQIIDMLIASLYQYQHKHRENFLTIIIDELQNQNFSDQSPIGKILKEGRKDYISFIGATQSYVTDQNIRAVMSKADTKIFLKPTHDSETAVAAELRYTESESQIFDRMERGDCIVKANFYSKTKKRNIPSIINGSVPKFEPPSENYFNYNINFLK